ncbi:MAG: hypothetical protein ACOCUH_04510, partial [Bacteriovoracia bacterium]
AEVIGRLETAENKEADIDSDYHFSNKFFAFGFKRLAVPEEEILEYFSFKTGFQAVNQFLYNNYDPAEGFVDKKHSEDYYAFVSNSNFLYKYFLSREHLTLSFDVLGEYRKEINDTIEEDFKKSVDNITLGIKGGNMFDGRAVTKEQWIEAMYKDTDMYYRKGFRLSGQDGGAEEFYQRKHKGKDALAQKLVDNIEKSLFNEGWLNGDYSIYQIYGILTSLERYLKDEKGKLDDDSQNRINQSKYVTEQLGDIQKSWRPKRINIFNNDSESKVKDTQTCLQTLFVNKTYLLANEYAKSLIDSISFSLKTLIDNVNTVIQIFEDIKKNFNDEYNSRCIESEKLKMNDSSAIIKFFEPRLVKEASDIFIKEKEVFNQKIGIIRKQLHETVRDGSYFERLKKMNKEVILENLTVASDGIIKSLFANKQEIERISNEQLLGGNILEKLKEKYPSGEEEELITLIQDIAKQSDVMMIENKEQQSYADSGKKDRYCEIIMPDFKGDPSYQQKIKELIETNVPNGKVSFGGKPSEIIFMTVEASLQLRYFEIVKILREKYDMMMANTKGKAASMCHIEAIELLSLDPKRSIPHYECNKVFNLFPLNDREKETLKTQVQDKAIPYLLIAKAIGLVEPMEDIDTGLVKLTYLPKNEYGLIDEDKRIVLGATLEESIGLIDQSVYDILSEDAGKALKNDYLHVEKKKSLIQKMVQDINELKERFNNSATNPVFVRFNKAANEAIKIINS